MTYLEAIEKHIHTTRNGWTPRYMSSTLLLVLIDHSSYPSNIPTRTVFHCPSEVTPNVSEVLLLLASMDDDGDRFPVLLVQVARCMW